MTKASRFLVVLIGLRLLAPPGICLCHADSPAVRFLASLLNSNTPVPAEPADDDDHEPGCPASPLASGLGLQPAPVLVPPLLACAAPGPFAPVLPAAVLLAAPSPLACPPPDSSLYLIDCTLLI